MKKVSVADVLEMPVPQRILFVEQVWDSIAATPDKVPVTKAQHTELERRLLRHLRNRK